MLLSATAGWASVSAPTLIVDMPHDGLGVPSSPALLTPQNLPTCRDAGLVERRNRRSPFVEPSQRASPLRMKQNPRLQTATLPANNPWLTFPSAQPATATTSRPTPGQSAELFLLPHDEIHFSRPLVCLCELDLNRGRFPASPALVSAARERMDRGPSARQRPARCNGFWRRTR